MGFWDKLKEITKPYDDDEDFLDEMDAEEETPAAKQQTQQRASRSSYSEPAQDKRSNPFYGFGGGTAGYERTSTSTQSQAARSQPRDNKVVNINATTQVQVVLVKPERFEAAAEVADHLRERRTVVMNLEQTSKETSRRLIDFLSGVAYAQDGKIKKVALNTYIITPYNVDLMGDLLDELENNGMYF